MLKRRRFKQTTSLAERLMEDVSQLKEKLAALAPGPSVTTSSSESVKVRRPRTSMSG
jgi:hypothetical protein